MGMDQLIYRVADPANREQASPTVGLCFSDATAKKKRPGFSWNRTFSVLRVESVAFEGEGYALATTDAQRRQAFLGIAFDHFMQQGHQHTAA